MKKILFIIFSTCLLFVSCKQQEETIDIDVLVIGGSASGITAGLQSSRMGIKTMIIEETNWLGGMLTSAGVSAIDGNYNLPAGIWGEFKQQLSDYYGGMDSLKTGWVSNVLFEPSVGNRIFHDMVAKEENLILLDFTKVFSIEKVEKKWLVKIQKEGEPIKNIKAKILIDATELGDIAKICGAKYDIGMDTRNETGESMAPEKSNNIIQDITYVVTLKDYGHDVTIPCPEGFDPEEFSCCCENHYCKNETEKLWSKDMMIKYGKLPNNKYMINWPADGNDYYENIIEMTPEERHEALKKAKSHTMRFVYFIQHELGFCNLGLADDEYPTEDKLPFIPYHRESRRIHGLVRFTFNDLINPYTQKTALYRTCIAVGDYPVDHHHKCYNDTEPIPELNIPPVPSYGLPLGVLIPKDVDGLIVAEKSISVSNIVNGTTRLQPVVLQIGQAAGALAALAIKDSIAICNVPVRKVQNVILESGGYLLPYLDVPVKDPIFKSLQRIGSTGIMKGEGKHIGWSNQTWFRADTILYADELEGLKDMYPTIANNFSFKHNIIIVKDAINIIETISKSQNLDSENIMADIEKIWSQYQFGKLEMNRPILRGEMAVLIDNILNPYERIGIAITGKII